MECITAGIGLKLKHDISVGIRRKQCITAGIGLKLKRNIGQIII